jgi:hypothetical protein
MQEVKTIDQISADTAAAVFLRGDLAKLQPAELVRHYFAVCDSIGLNKLTKPFEYITLNGKLTLYATRNCTDQLRKIYGVSVEIVDRRMQDDMLVVHARATIRGNPLAQVGAPGASGRTDEDFGVVPLYPSLKGEQRSNQIMKCITKAKRRVTLSICGLSFMDETEVESIPDAAKINRAANAQIQNALDERAMQE